jgi:hypothetical protein
VIEVSNVLIGFPNRADASTLSSGSWQATLPLSNLKHRTLGKVARSTDDALASTKFDIDMNTTTKPIDVLAFVNHNLSLQAKFRIRASTVSNFATTTYDSGWTDVWPQVYTIETIISWYSESFWSLKYTQEEIEGYTRSLIHILPSTQVSRYWRIEFDDTLNSDGYVQIGRLFLSQLWEPSENAANGALTLGWETDTDVQKAIGGAEYFQKRTPRRVVKFTLDVLTQDEALANAFEIQRRAGIDQEVLYIHDSADTVHQLRRRFLGRVRQLSAIEYPYGNLSRTGFEISELL